MADDVPIRDAATVIVLREQEAGPAVLMGQRGKSAAFMPGKFVFPGGAVDAVDASVPVSGLSPECTARLSEESTLSPATIAAAGIRELWEETGQILGKPEQWVDAPIGWRGYAELGFAPHVSFEFFFRAVTPKGRPRRFDARFLLANASDLQSDPDDFSAAEDELSHLQWVTLSDARNFDLPFITKVVLSELQSYVACGQRLASVPLFRNDDERHLVSRLEGRPLL